jgi:hypothetical protein
MFEGLKIYSHDRLRASPNTNCYSSLIIVIFEGILAGMLTLEQPKVHLP